MVYLGHFRNGRIELDEDAQLPDGAEVEVATREAVQASDSTVQRSAKVSPILSIGY